MQASPPSVGRKHLETLCSEWSDVAYRDFERTEIDELLQSRAKLGRCSRAPHERVQRGKDLLRRRRKTQRCRVGRRVAVRRDRLTGKPVPGRHEQVTTVTKHRIYTMSFASVYPHYIAKAEKKGRTKAEVDEIICWLTGYSRKELEAQLTKKADVEAFIAEAPRLFASRSLINGVVCGV
jgi:hypothetical protein